MSELNPRPAPNALDRATDALRGATVLAGPPAELTAATFAAIQDRLAVAVPAKVNTSSRRRMIMRTIGFGSATAAAIAIAVLVWSPGQSSAAVLDSAIANARKAKSFEAKITLTLDEKTKQEMSVKSQDGRVRIDMDATLVVGTGATVMLLDYPKKLGLMLIKGKQIAMWNDDPTVYLPLPDAVAKRLAAAEVPTMADALGEMKGAKFETLPDAELENRTTKVFAVKDFQWPDETDKTDVILWIDAKTQTIVKIRVEYTTGKQKGTMMEALMQSWNDKLEASQFEMVVPQGYQELNKPEKK